MPTDGSGAYMAVYLSSLDPPTLYPENAQPFLWGTKPNNPSQQGPIQWDDDNPTDGQITAPDECYDYTFGVCPDPLGASMAFWAAAAGCQPSNGDVDSNGCVDDADLLAVLFNFGNTGSGPRTPTATKWWTTPTCWRCCSTSAAAANPPLPYPLPLTKGERVTLFMLLGQGVFVPSVPARRGGLRA
jgi:hypothetical protein